MRNKWLLGVGGALLVVGIAAVAMGGGVPALYLAFIGVILVLAGFLVGPRYKADLTAPPEGYEPTGETFVDPTSHHTIEVYRRPQDGHRVYVRKS